MRKKSIGPIVAGAVAVVFLSINGAYYLIPQTIKKIAVERQAEALGTRDLDIVEQIIEDEYFNLCQRMVWDDELLKDALKFYLLTQGHRHIYTKMTSDEICEDIRARRKLRERTLYRLNKDQN